LKRWLFNNLSLYKEKIYINIWISSW